MIGKKFKLITKEVSYVSSRKTRIFSDGLICYFHPQYPNRQFNQFGIQISKKFHKSAVKRNDLKRIFFIATNDLLYYSQTSFYKFFIVVGNKDYEKLNQWILLPKKDRINEIKKYFIYHLHIFLKGTSKKS